MHSCADPFLMLKEGALVSFPICHQSIHRNSGPFLASTLLLLLSSPLLLLRPCTHSNLPTAWSAAFHSRPSSQSTPKIFHPAAKWNFTQRCHTAPPHCIALHNAVEPFRVGGGIPPHIEVSPKVAFRGFPRASAPDAHSFTSPAFCDAIQITPCREKGRCTELRVATERFTSLW